MTHPCAGHMASCDHCYLCEILKICCASVPAGQRMRLEAEHRAQHDLRVAIAKEAETTPSLGALVAADAEHDRSTHALPAAPTAELPPITDQPVYTDSRKEILHGIPDAHSTR